MEEEGRGRAGKGSTEDVEPLRMRDGVGTVERDALGRGRGREVEVAEEEDLKEKEEG